MLVNAFRRHFQTKKHLENIKGAWHKYRYEDKVGTLYYKLEHATAGPEGSSGGYVTFATTPNGERGLSQKYRMSWKNKEDQFLSRARDFCRSVVKARKKAAQDADKSARERKRQQKNAQREAMRKRATANIEALAAARKPAKKAAPKKAVTSASLRLEKKSLLKKLEDAGMNIHAEGHGTMGRIASTLRRAE